MAIPFRVRVFRGEQLLSERLFSDSLVKLGKHASAHVPLDDRAASFVHAVLTTDGDEIALTDISGRGTYVNGKSIGKKVLLPGDEIRIAGLRILVDLPPAPSPTPGQPVQPVQEAHPVHQVHSVHPVHDLQSAQVVHPAPVPEPLPEPPPPRQLRPGERPVLQLSCFWGDQLLQVTQHDEPKTLLMGPTPRCAVKAGSHERPLIEPADGGFALNVDEGLEAHLRRGDEVCSLEPGVHPLSPTDLAWMEIGNLRVEARFAAAAERARVPVAESIDFRLVNLVLALSFVAAGFAVSTQFRQKDDLIADDLTAATQIFVKVHQPIQHAKTRTDALPSLESTDAAPPAPKHSGAQGQAGDPAVKHKKPAIGALGSLRVDTQNLVSRTGLLGGIGGPSVEGVLGPGGIQGDVRAALGNLTGPSYGSAGGMMGLGQRGLGPGGGGDLRTFGIGNIKTVGKLTGYGLKDGLTPGSKPRSGPPEIDNTPPVVDGSLDPDLVRKVIRDHVAHIRFCYEERLASNPSLAGKVRIRFLVNGQGKVPEASIAEGSTLDDPQLSACLLSRFRSWQFPVPKGGGSAIVTYPVWLRPSGE